MREAGHTDDDKKREDNKKQRTEMRFVVYAGSWWSNKKGRIGKPNGEL